MNDKTKQASRIILPSQDGVANLDIRRVKSELEGKSKPGEMCGHMPADMVDHVVAELKDMIAAVEKGEVSSVCTLGIMPQTSFIEAGKAFIGANDGDLEKIDSLFHAALAERLEEREPPDDEAG